MPPTGPEWGLVRVEAREADGNFCKRFLPPGAVGTQKDKAHCIFCGLTFVAAAHLIRVHVARAEGNHVRACTGVTPRDGESEPAYQAREKQCQEGESWSGGKRFAETLSLVSPLLPAGNAMCALMDTLARKEEETTAKQALDRATGGKASGAPKLTDQPTWLANGVKKKQEAADYELTLALMCAGVAPNVMDCPEVKSALKTVALVGSGYNPPGRRAVGGRLAKLVRQTVGEKVREASARAELGGFTLCSDGITSEKNTPIINVVLVCGGEVEFVEARDCSGKVKDGEFLAREIIIPAIMARKDPYSVVQVVMDNATRSAWPIIEKECPWVVCTPCWPHCLDLLLEDIGKLPFFRLLFRDVNRIRMFLRNKGMALYVFRTYATHSIASPGATRFRSLLIMLSSLLRVKEAVVKTLVDGNLREYIGKYKNQKARAREEEEEGKALGTRYGELRALALDDEFWERCKLAQEIMLPIGKLQAFTDSNSATGSKVHYHFYVMQSTIEKLDFGEETELKENVLYLANKRWDYATSDLTLTGNLLDPEFWDCDLEEKSFDAFCRMVDRTYPLPDESKYAETEAGVAAFQADTAEVKRKRTAAENQLSYYKNRTLGIFTRDSAKSAATTESAYDWWFLYGLMTPELRLVALRVTAQPCGAGSSERAHKDMGAVLTKKRTRMDWEKVEDAVYVRMNSRLLNKTRDLDYKVKVIPDAGGWEDDSDVDDGTPAEVETLAEAEQRVVAARAARVQKALREADSDEAAAYAEEAAEEAPEPAAAPDAWAEARRERRGAAPTPAEKEEHAKRKRACTAAAAKRVPPAPECVAATAEEKERREGRRVRRPARYDD